MRFQSSIFTDIISALACCDAFQSASNPGKARLLDESTSQGPSLWHARMPNSERFQFLKLESIQSEYTCCRSTCLSSTPCWLKLSMLFLSLIGPTLEPLGSDAQYFVRYPCGLSSQTSLYFSDRVRDELACILERCNSDHCWASRVPPADDVLPLTKRRLPT